MRYNNTCPKCNSEKVLEIKGHKFNQGQHIALTKWSTKFEALDRYICLDCGYTEEYVQLNSKFKTWAEKEYKQQSRDFDEYV